MDAAHMGADLERVLVTEEEIRVRLGELAGEIAAEYEGKDLLLVGVLKGAVMVMADLMRALPMTVPVDWMAVSSYGSGTKSSGVVRILKDLDADITGRHVLIVEDIVDSGLTLAYLRKNLAARGPASMEVCALLVKEGLQRVELAVRVGACGIEVADCHPSKPVAVAVPAQDLLHHKLRLTVRIHR